MLAITYQCRLHSLPLSQVQKGDLLFLREGISDEIVLEQRWIPHIGIAIGRGEWVHSSFKRSGCWIERFSAPCDEYAKRAVERIICGSKVLIYIDPRNRQMREQFGVLLFVKISREIIPFIKNNCIL
jgi:hypothetical protein